MTFWCVRVNDVLQRIVEAPTRDAAVTQVREAVDGGLRYSAEVVAPRLAHVLEDAQGIDRKRLLLQLDGLNPVVKAEQRRTLRSRLERAIAEDEDTQAWLHDQLERAPVMTEARAAPLLAMLENSWRQRAISQLTSGFREDPRRAH